MIEANYHATFCSQKGFYFKTPDGAASILSSSYWLLYCHQDVQMSISDRCCHRAFLKQRSLISVNWYKQPSLVLGECFAALHYSRNGIRSIRSQGRPALSFCRTTCSDYKPYGLCKTSDYSIYTCTIIILSSVLFFWQYPKYDFVNTLYAVLPQMYVVVTCNCATYLYAFSRIRCRNQTRVNIKVFVADQLILIRSLQLYRD